MKRIILKNIVVKGNRVEYIAEYPSEFAKFISKNSTNLFVEYPEVYNLEKVPLGILTIPFVANTLTVSMLLNMSISVPELDGTYMRSINTIKMVYKRMYPYMKTNFTVIADKLTDTKYSGDKSLLFFTGGLDATSALASLYNKKPLLVNIWGGDIPTADTISHQETERYFSDLTSTTGLSYIFVKSNCRELYNEQLVTKKCAFKLLPWQNHGW